MAGLSPSCSHGSGLWSWASRGVTSSLRLFNSNEGRRQGQAEGRELQPERRAVGSDIPGPGAAENACG